MLMGRAWVFPSNVDTDQITPGTLLYTNNLAEICFAQMRPEFSKQVQKGDLIIANQNFGCGSSRETAPQAILESGIEAIMAVSYARIFKRNARNLGLPIFTIPISAYQYIKDKEEITLDFGTGKLTTSAEEFQAQPALTGTSLEIIQSGGLMPYLKANDWTYEGAEG